MSELRMSSKISSGRIRRQAGLPPHIMALFALLLVLGSSGTAWAITVGEMENKLLCTCGCAKPSLATCTCAVADDMRLDLNEQMEAGDGEKEIIAFMKSKYGKEVVNVPDKSGFDLTAWLMPFAVVFAGSVGVVKVMSTWIKKSKGGGEDHHTDGGDGGPDSAVDERIEKELKDVGW